jgi:hypothetical protein
MSPWSPMSRRHRRYRRRDIGADVARCADVAEVV